MKAIRVALAMLLFATPLFACEALLPKNPLKTAAVCGRVEDPAGQPLANFELRLVRKDQSVVSEVFTDATGHFEFPQLPKRDYFMATNSKGWAPIGWAVRVTASRTSQNCDDLNGATVAGLRRVDQQEGIPAQILIGRSDVRCGLGNGL